MGSGLWFITILKEQPWIGLVIGIILFLLLFLAKRWLFKKLMADQKSE
jgi:flagellar biogenesis protein FliO